MLNKALKHLNDEIPIVIVANKIDQHNIDKDGVIKRIGVRIEKLIGDLDQPNCSYFFTSALFDENVEEVFDWIYEHRVIDE